MVYERECCRNIVIVKDINTTATQGSSANVYYNGAALNDGIAFHAYDKQHGDELCVSNGTQAGTMLINDISPGENTSYPKNFSSKNNYAYFIAFPTADGNTATIYRTNGQSNGLKRFFVQRGAIYFLRMAIIAWQIMDSSLRWSLIGILTTMNCGVVTERPPAAMW